MVKIFVEGGGDASSLRAECRHGFSCFFAAAGCQGKMPRIIACGSRNDAFASFCTAIGQGERAFLLVDSEDALDDVCQRGQPERWRPWEHLKRRDQWEKPPAADDMACHLMVQCMEAWFLADRETLQSFFGQGFNPKVLPAKENPVERLSKDQVFSALARATQNCQAKGKYGKGEHSFKILARLAPERVVAASPWAKRLVDGVKNHAGG